jgi:hypothetical protein
MAELMSISVSLGIKIGNSRLIDNLKACWVGCFNLDVTITKI